MARILVAGGGPAGCAVAVTARRCGHDVTLLDDARRLRTWPGESLPAGGGELVASVFGGDVLSGHSMAYGTSAAWGSDELVDHDYMAHWSGHGWHLDRATFDASLRNVAIAHGVEAIHDRLSTVGGSPGAWSVNGKWSAEWLIDATGRAGAIATRLGSSLTRCDDQIALVAIVPDLGGARVTMVETVREGWWYSSPLSGGQRVVALITDADLVAPDRAATWRESLARTRHVAQLLEKSDSVDVGAYPAGTAYRETLVGDHWIAVGDAAASFDPLSSQGLITGVVMAARAAASLGDDMGQWAADYGAVLDEHLALREGYMALESRWSDEPFWARRRSA